MNVVGRKAFSFFHLIVILAWSWIVTPGKSEVTSCNLISEGTECIQHCERSKRGDEDCILSAGRHNSTPGSKLCSQVCDPKDGNGKKCLFHCNASHECVQHCSPGHCRHMKCSKNSYLCEQHCTAGGCRNMECNSRKCYQNCRNGGCNMKCGPNVEYCEQICPGGSCHMVCEGKTCRAYCPAGTCNTQGPSSEVMTQCNIQSNIQGNKHHCVQECPAHGCYCKASGRVRSCKQACAAGKETDSCSSITCHSHLCRQDCGSNCSLTCSANQCIQQCSGSGCHFQCSENVRFCRQICLKGNCVFNCAAKKCKNECPGGNCIFNRVGDEVGLFLDAKCDYRHNGQCEPLCKECVHGGHDLKCAGGNDDECTQTCLGGRCKNVKCAAKKFCAQFCAGGKCDAMECKSKECLQRCPGGNCGKIECTSKNCTQTCLGNCEKMTCDATECRQECFLGNCNMECSSNVSKCYQKCYSGKCTFKCHGKQCYEICPKGKCNLESLSGGMARVMANVATFLVTSLTMYINV